MILLEWKMNDKQNQISVGYVVVLCLVYAVLHSIVVITYYAPPSMMRGCAELSSFFDSNAVISGCC